MKRIFIVIVLLTVISNYSMATTEDNLHWFKDAKFGLFIHWGLYSQTAGEWKGHPTEGGEHFMLYERIPLKEYAPVLVVHVVILFACADNVHLYFERYNLEICLLINFHFIPPIFQA